MEPKVWWLLNSIAQAMNATEIKHSMGTDEVPMGTTSQLFYSW